MFYTTVFHRQWLGRISIWAALIYIHVVVVCKNQMCMGFFGRGRANRNLFLTTTTVVMNSVFQRRNGPENEHAQTYGR